MATKYEELVTNLKNKLILQQIKVKKIFSLINNKKYDEIISIVNDATILTLIKDIELERVKIGNNLEKKLNNLLWLNNILIQCNEEPQPTKTKAIKMLKSRVFINIYDLEAENFEKRTTKDLLKKELKNKANRFPLQSAKENETLKCFLIKI